MKVEIPEVSLVVLVGVSGSGKSTFARKHFKRTEIISSDFCRALVSDDPNDQNATNDAFDVLHYIAAKRLAAMRLVVVDATNVQPESRKGLVSLARKHHCLPTAIVLNLDPKICSERNRLREDRSFGSHVIRRQHQQLKRSLRKLRREGFRRIAVLTSPEDVEAATVERTRLWTNLRHDHGPFDIIGDVHGCADELRDLFEKLGYTISGTLQAPKVEPPVGRKAVFVGDLVDRGPDSPGVLRLVMGMVEAGTARCVPGNHEIKLLKKLRGKSVRLSHGLEETLQQLEHESEEFKKRVEEFIFGLISHCVLDDGKLVVAHAGLAEDLQGRASGKVRSFALFGDTTGETDEFGLPVRYDWAADYRGKASVVYGHTPVLEAEWQNRTLCVDTGCVFGGKLTALRYPENELVSVPARAVHYEPVKPLHAQGRSTRDGYDLLDISDVTGKRIVATRIVPSVTIREGNAVAALEVMSRFSVDPRWLIYLPPTMSPSETCPDGKLLEHPDQAFDYYARQGVQEIICEQKHMGSRAVVIVCRDADAAQRRFRVTSDSGVVYTRTGRPFFRDKTVEIALLQQVRGALDTAGFWKKFKTDWVCLDAELMPWSYKAHELLKAQYAAVGAAGSAALGQSLDVLRSALQRGAGDPDLLARFERRREALERYGAAWRHYCWEASGIPDLKLAPFHLLATEGKVHTDQPHTWHMETLASLCTHSPVLMATPYKTLAPANAEQRQATIEWWENHTADGGEGMVVKPRDWIVRGKKGRVVQPAIKCRGREYLRIIYGPEYTAPEHLKRLRKRGLSRKRSLAMREFALGVEGLQRFVECEPLYRVHECVFGVLALESEPIDPRL